MRILILTPMESRNLDVRFRHMMVGEAGMFGAAPARDRRAAETGPGQIVNLLTIAALTATVANLASLGVVFGAVALLGTMRDLAPRDAVRRHGSVANLSATPAGRGNRDCTPPPPGTTGSWRTEGHGRWVFNAGGDGHDQPPLRPAPSCARP